MALTMPRLSEGCRQHLKDALRADDPGRKNYHIRQVLQLCGCDDVPDDIAEKGLGGSENRTIEE
jgi:hypothetical protein